VRKEISGGYGESVWRSQFVQLESGGAGLTRLLSVPLETSVSTSKLQDLVISPTYERSL
jgi:hypothetical protein